MEPHAGSFLMFEDVRRGLIQKIGEQAEIRHFIVEFRLIWRTGFSRLRQVLVYVRHDENGGSMACVCCAEALCTFRGGAFRSSDSTRTWASPGLGCGRVWRLLSGFWPHPTSIWCQSLQVPPTTRAVGHGDINMLQNPGWPLCGKRPDTAGRL